MHYLCCMSTYISEVEVNHFVTKSVHKCCMSTMLLYNDLTVLFCQKETM